MPVDREQHIDEVMESPERKAEYDLWQYHQEQRQREADEISQEDLEAAGWLFNFHFGPG